MSVSSNGRLEIDVVVVVPGAYVDVADIDVDALLVGGNGRARFGC